MGDKRVGWTPLEKDMWDLSEYNIHTHALNAVKDSGRWDYGFIWCFHWVKWGQQWLFICVFIILPLWAADSYEYYTVHTEKVKKETQTH